MIIMIMMITVMIYDDDNLAQMGEEESRAWQRGANSDASLRPFGWFCLHKQNCQHQNHPHHQDLNVIFKNIQIDTIRINDESSMTL